MNKTSGGEKKGDQTVGTKKSKKKTPKLLVTKRPLDEQNCVPD